MKTMKIKLVSFTIKGGRLCAMLQNELNRRGHHAEGCCKYAVKGMGLLDCSIGEFTKKVFALCDAIVFIGSAGIAVRAIAPLLKSKQSDPAVLVIDETARYVIPVLSGHIGGANELAQIISEMLGARPVITTATDCNELFAVDSWAVKNDCHIANIEGVKHISAAILNGEEVGLHCDFPVEGELPEGLNRSDSTKTGISISLKNIQPFEHTLHLIPKQFVLGIGCRKNTGYDKLLEFVNSCLRECGISPYEVKAVASIDLKLNEEALITLTRDWKVPFYTYSAQELSMVPGEFTRSSFVEAAAGVDNVCERAAIRACGGKLVLNKTCGGGMTIAVAKQEWRCSF